MREAWAHRFARVTRVIPQLQPPKFYLALSWNGGMVWTATHGNSPKRRRKAAQLMLRRAPKETRNAGTPGTCTPLRNGKSGAISPWKRQQSRQGLDRLSFLFPSRRESGYYHLSQASHSPAAPLTQPRRPQNSRKLLEVHVSSEQGRVVTQKNENN